MMNSPSFIQLITLIIITNLSHGRILRESDTKQCGENLDLCFEDKDCCTGMICNSDVPSLPSRCRVDPNTKENKGIELNGSALRLKLLLSEKQQKSAPKCLENLESCTDDSECCDDMTCDRSTKSSGNRCRHTVADYARRKLEEFCKNNLETCSSDNDCCQNLFCDTSLPSLGYRCHAIPSKAKQSSDVELSPVSNSIQKEAKCLENLGICEKDSDCCDEMLCDSSMSSSLGNRCRYPAPSYPAASIRGVSSSSSNKCLQPFDKCNSDNDCCGNDVKCMQTPDKKEKRCHDPSTSWNVSNAPSKQSNGGQCLSWRDDCTSNQNGCCEGLTCSTFNKSDLKMECHFVSYEVKIKY